MLYPKNRRYYDISHFRAPYKNAVISGFGRFGQENGTENGGLEVEAIAEEEDFPDAELPATIERGADWAVPTAEDIERWIDQAETSEAVDAAKDLAQSFVQSEPVQAVIEQAAEIKKEVLRQKGWAKLAFWGIVIWVGYKLFIK